MAKIDKSTQKPRPAASQTDQDDTAQRKKQPLKVLNKDDEKPKKTDDA